MLNLNEPKQEFINYKSQITNHKQITIPNDQAELGFIELSSMIKKERNK